MDAHYRAKDRDERYEMFNMEQQEKRKQTIMSLIGKRGAGLPGGAGAAPSEVTKMSTYGQWLQKNGGDPKLVADLMASGDIEGMEKLVTNIQGTMGKYKEYGDPIPETFVNDILGEAVVTPSRTIEYDYTDFAKRYGIELTPEEQELYRTTETVQGGIVGTPATYEEKLTPTEIRDMRQMVITPALDRATQEKQKLYKLSEQLSDPSSEVPPEVKTAITSRIMQVDQAMSSAKGDTPNYAPLVSLYGNEFYSEVSEYYPRFQKAPQDPILSAATQPGIPWVLPNDFVAQWLIENGVLTDKDTFAIER